MSESSKSNRGRKRSLTDSARKRNRSIVSAKWNKSRVYVGDQFQRWNDLKDELNVQTHAEVARILLDNYHSNKTVTVQTDSVQQNIVMEEEALPAVSIPTTSTLTPGAVHSLFRTPCDVSDISSAGENLSLTIDEDETWLIEDNSPGEEFEPSFNFTLRHNNADHLPIEDSDDESDISGDDPADATETDYEINRIKSIDDMDILTNDRPLLVYQQPLLDLANIQISTLCKVCNEAVNISVDTVASATYLKWTDACRRPFRQQFPKKLQHWLDFHRIQKTYLVPAIDRFWIQKQDETIMEFQNTDVIVLGDGRMDSPGHCAQYCSYTFMEYTSKKILCITTMDKRSTDRKSTNLEKACFMKRNAVFKDKGIKVVEVVTDAHVQIASVMTEVATTKEEFQDVWYGVLHHVVNEHQWSVPFANSTVSNSCQHGPLEDGAQSKDYLKKGSPPHNALRKIAMDKRLVNNIPYYLNCRWQRSYNKKTSRWSVHPVKEDKKYSYIQDLIRQIVIQRIEDEIGISRHLKKQVIQGVYQPIWRQNNPVYTGCLWKSHKVASYPSRVPSSVATNRSIPDVYGSHQEIQSYPSPVPSLSDKIRSIHDVYGSPQEAASYGSRVPSSPDKIRSIPDVYGSPQEAASYVSRVPSSPDKIRSIQDVYGSPQEAASYLSRVPSSPDKIRSIQDAYGSQQEIESYPRLVSSSPDKIRTKLGQHKMFIDLSKKLNPSHVSSSPDKIRSIQDVYGSPQKMSSSQGSVPSSLDKIRSIQDLSGYQQKAASVKDDIGAKSYISDDNISVHSILSITHKSTTSKSDFASVQSRGSFTVKSGESVKSYDDFIDNDSN
ncbi:unnamed protein product [Mytilus edulis]|uniref:Uncharacterized protein n=1 Tax=Mytilus edulis TaxID=6550 RepID=A0A8S3T3H2_MYTED|nr:unnamed protein product [Mytilus edulis]